jgi:O-antigen/teichoic acid export membrane protein
MNVSNNYFEAAPRILRWSAVRMQSSPLKRQLLGEGAWVVFGQAVSAAAMFIGTRMLTEFVAPSVFGAVSLLVGVVTFGTATFCVPQLHAASRFYPELAPKGQVLALRRTIGHSLRWTTGLLVVLVLIGGAVVAAFSAVSYWAFVLLAGLLVSEVFRTLETNILSAARRQREYAIWTATENCFRPFLAVIFVWLLGAKPQSILLGYLLATLGILALYHIRFERRDSTDELCRPIDRSKLSIQVWQYALPLMPLALVSWITSLGDRYLIGGTLGLEAVGLYAAAYGLTSRLLSTFPGAFLLLTLRPIYFQAASENNRELERKALRIWFAALVTLSLLLVLVVTVTGKVVVEWLLAPSYHSCWTLMPILAAGFAMMGWSQVFNTVSLAHKNSKNVLYSESGAAAVMVVCIVPATISLGLAGAALATCMSYFVQLILSYLLARPYLTSETRSA